MSFDSYSATVDFEGLEFSLPQNYRYIARDEFGFVQMWRNKPVKDPIYGGFNGFGEMPVTLGHQKGDGLEPVIRKYRSRKNVRAILAITGIVK